MIILAISPHTDDSELGAGGSIARFVQDGHTVHCVAMSDLLRGDLPDEFRNAMAALGVVNDNVIIGNFPNRYFPGCRQAILDYLNGLRQQLEPDMVLVPASGDVHQDHHTVTGEALRVFRHTTMLGYELPSNLTGRCFQPSCMIALHSEHMVAKMVALGCYVSQQHRVYMDEEFIYSLARVRGLQAGSLYAEAFEVLRWIW